MVPVFGIPLIWPTWAIIQNQTGSWIRDVFWQSGRGSGEIATIMLYLLEVDPMFTILGFAGLAYATYRRKLFIILWMVPFLVFVSLIGFLQYFHFIMIMPIMAIASAYIIQSMTYKIIKQKKIIFPSIALTIIIVGVGFSNILINTTVSESQFEAIEFVNNNLEEDVTVLASPVYTWILDGIYGHSNIMSDYSQILYYETPTNKHLVIDDSHYRLDLSKGEKLEQTSKYPLQVEFSDKFPNTNTEQFPFQSLKFTGEGKDIRIRTNYQNTIQDE